MSGTADQSFKFTAGEPALAAALARLAVEDGVAVPLLGEATRRRLLAATERLAYRAARPTVGDGERQVRQDFELSMDFPPESPFRRFAGALERLIGGALRRLEPPPLEEVRFNDLIVQRYPAGSDGITPHRDHIRYQGLVALVNLAGRGRFFVCNNRAGEDARELPDGPGILLLMRAPPFAGLRDRPFHFLADVTEARVSLGLRYDTRPDEPT